MTNRRLHTIEGLLLLCLIGVLAGLLGCGETPLPEMEGMVGIPAGKFIMGTDEGDVDEVPAHEVHLDAYYIGTYEVTNKEYREFVEDAGYRAPKGWENDRFSQPESPVVGVSWIDATKYCEWLSSKKGANYRLPTEAEWEKAARGTKGQIYPWGDFWDPVRCKWGSEEEGHLRHTVAAGSFESGKSPYGAHDMAGNAWEWCSDWYDPGYYKFSDKKDPQGALTGDQKVVRGGCWNDNSRYCRAVDRWPVEMTYNDIYVGFRVCRSK